ncbi:hypothetical protein O1611_g9447 [Lasiodiplodia mahajangana]|uniref:Uncharacterized protein n=1 Tax=Lasiodiplodia mahajangana TaxID=1108764 RepID=A0ACC2J9R1_9PEZI|nr:hypothetical protein O1611_g9447 [Lasiodiplodia mahajangana]
MPRTGGDDVLVPARPSDNANGLADLENQLTSTATDSDADDLRGDSQAQKRGLRDKGPAWAPQLNEVAADEEVKHATE